MTDLYQMQAEIQNIVHDKVVEEPLRFAQAAALCAMSNPEGLIFLEQVFDCLAKAKLAQAAGLEAVSELRRLSGDKC